MAARGNLTEHVDERCLVGGAALHGAGGEGVVAGQWHRIGSGCRQVVERGRSPCRRAGRTGSGIASDCERDDLALASRRSGSRLQCLLRSLRACGCRGRRVGCGHERVGGTDGLGGGFGQRVTAVAAGSTRGQRRSRRQARRPQSLARPRPGRSCTAGSTRVSPATLTIVRPVRRAARWLRRPARWLDDRLGCSLNGLRRRRDASLACRHVHERLGRSLDRLGCGSTAVRPHGRRQPAWRRLATACTVSARCDDRVAAAHRPAPSWSRPTRLPAQRPFRWPRRRRRQPARTASTTGSATAWTVSTAGSTSHRSPLRPVQQPRHNRLGDFDHRLGSGLDGLHGRLDDSLTRRLTTSATGSVASTTGSATAWTVSTAGSTIASSRQRRFDDRLGSFDHRSATASTTGSATSHTGSATASTTGSAAGSTASPARQQLRRPARRLRPPHRSTASTTGSATASANRLGHFDHRLGNGLDGIYDRLDTASLPARRLLRRPARQQLRPPARQQPGRSLPPARHRITRGCRPPRRPARQLRPQARQQPPPPARRHRSPARRQPRPTGSATPQPPRPARGNSFDHRLGGFDHRLARPLDHRLGNSLDAPARRLRPPARQRPGRLYGRLDHQLVDSTRLGDSFDDRLGSFHHRLGNSLDRLYRRLDHRRSAASTASTAGSAASTHRFGDRFDDRLGHIASPARRLLRRPARQLSTPRPARSSFDDRLGGFDDRSLGGCHRLGSGLDGLYCGLDHRITRRADDAVDGLSGPKRAVAVTVSTGSAAAWTASGSTVTLSTNSVAGSVTATSSAAGDPLTSSSSGETTDSAELGNEPAASDRADTPASVLASGLDTRSGRGRAGQRLERIVHRSDRPRWARMKSPTLRQRRSECSESRPLPAAPSAHLPPLIRRALIPDASVSVGGDAWVAGCVACSTTEVTASAAGASGVADVISGCATGEGGALSTAGAAAAGAGAAAGCGALSTAGVGAAGAGAGARSADGALSQRSRSWRGTRSTTGVRGAGAGADALDNRRCGGGCRRRDRR